MYTCMSSVSNPIFFTETGNGIFTFVENILSILSRGHVSLGTSDVVFTPSDLEELLSGLPRWWVDLKVPREQAGIVACSDQHEAALDDVVLACQRIAKDLTVRLQLLQQSLPFLSECGQIRTSLQERSWPKDDFVALSKRLKTFKTELEDSILPSLR